MRGYLQDTLVLRVVQLHIHMDSWGLILFIPTRGGARSGFSTISISEPPGMGSWFGLGRAAYRVGIYVSFYSSYLFTTGISWLNPGYGEHAT